MGVLGFLSWALHLWSVEQIPHARVWLVPGDFWGDQQGLCVLQQLWRNVEAARGGYVFILCFLFIFYLFFLVFRCFFIIFMFFLLFILYFSLFIVYLFCIFSLFFLYLFSILYSFFILYFSLFFLYLFILARAGEELDFEVPLSFPTGLNSADGEGKRAKSKENP